MDNNINPVRACGKWLQEAADSDLEITLGSSQLRLLGEFLASIDVFPNALPGRSVAPRPRPRPVPVLSRAADDPCPQCGGQMIKTKCDKVCQNCNFVKKGECGG